MPELPEVETIRRTLEPAITGRIITGLRTGSFPGVLGSTPAEVVAREISGRTITSVQRRGKFLVIHLNGDLAFVVHLRMTGRLVLRDRLAPPERFEHLAIELDIGLDVRFADQRKFGRVLLLDRAGLGQLECQLGAEPLDPEFTAGKFADLLRGRQGKIKSVLLDQRLIAGIGNIYADEALFRAGIHPERRASSLFQDEVERLHGAIQSVLREGLVNRGTTFSSYRDGWGEPGTNQANLGVYGRGRRGEPCPCCGASLRCVVVSGRSSHFCPHCQPAP
ncbi:MAG: formamidopyrimidine-DNA glycosylase [Chloroflexota bacterium]